MKGSKPNFCSKKPDSGVGVAAAIFVGIAVALVAGRLWLSPLALGRR